MATAETRRIEDLNAPVLTGAQREALAAAEDASVELTVDAVLEAAREQARLQDFGPEDFVERLRLILEVVAWDGHTRLSQLTTFRRIVDKAVNRLATIDLLKRHPEIREEPIEAPLFVAGLPRSGTTHLLNLIAADSRFQAMPYWQVLRPVPLWSERELGADGLDPRYAAAQARWEGMQRMNPYQAVWHPMDPDHISEDGELQMQDFSSYVWEFSLWAPQWRDHYLSHDQTPHYEFQKLLMQILQWQRGERLRWITKAPQHMEQLVPIMNAFPDALVVFTHRDPVASLQSIASNYAYTMRWREREPDAGRAFAYWADRYERLLDAYLRDVGRVPEAQRFDVLYREFVGDDVGMVERIYRAAGLEMTEQARGELDAYMSTHRQGHGGRLRFDMRADFRAEPAVVRERYRAYTDAIPVGVEVA
jgi:Sulfotransferase family